MSIAPSSSAIWAAGALTGPFPTAGPAPQQAEVLNLSVSPNVTYSGTIRLSKMGYCLDDRNNSSSNGAVVQVWRCNGLANQRWQVMSDGTIRHNGLCLDAAGYGTANGTSRKSGPTTARSTRSGPPADEGPRAGLLRRRA